MGNQDPAISTTHVGGPTTEKQTQWHDEADASSLDAAKTEGNEGIILEGDAKCEDLAPVVKGVRTLEDAGDQGGQDEVKAKDEEKEVLEGDVITALAAKQQPSPGKNAIHTDNSKTVNPTALARERELQYRLFVQGTFGNQEHPALTKEEREVRDQNLREQGRAREERAKRRQEVKQEKQAKQKQEEGEESSQWPLTRRQERKQRQLANQKKKREEEEELVRLRECKKELLVLKASLPQAQGIPAPSGLPSQPYQDAQPSGTETRVRVLKLARLEQELQQAGEGATDSEHLLASGSALIVKEESTAPEIFHVDTHKEAGQQPNDASPNGMTLRKMENDNGKFQFELMVNLKGINKRGRPDSQTEGTTSTVMEDDTGVIPTITKVAISLESTTEYRISVSGERPRKRLRTRKPTV